MCNHVSQAIDTKETFVAITRHQRTFWHNAQSNIRFPVPLKTNAVVHQIICEIYLKFMMTKICWVLLHPVRCSHFLHSINVLCWTNARTCIWTIISMKGWWFPWVCVMSCKLHPWCMNWTAGLNLFPPLFLLSLQEHFRNQLDWIWTINERNKLCISQHIGLSLCINHTIVSLLQTLSTMNVAPINTKCVTLCLWFCFIQWARLVICNNTTKVYEVSNIFWLRKLWIGCTFQLP